MRAKGKLVGVDTIEGSTFFNIRIDDFSEGTPLRGDAVVIVDTETENRDAKVVELVRGMHLQRVAASNTRGPHVRCAFCSWTWDADAAEKHLRACPFSPFGLAPGQEEGATDGSAAG